MNFWPNTIALLVIDCFEEQFPKQGRGGIMTLKVFVTKKGFVFLGLAGI